MSGRHGTKSGDRMDHIRDVTEMREEDFEDESLDSDEAFDEDDENKFGDVLNAIAARNRAKKRGAGKAQSDGEEEDEEDEDEDDEDEDDEWNDESGAGGVLLSDLLKNDSKSDAAKQAEEERQRRKLVGMIVSKKSTVAERNEVASESEFNVAADKALSLSDLMGTMKPDGQAALLKAQLKKLSTGREKSLIEPVAPIVAARMERRVAYEEQSDEVGRNFQAGVQRHRSMSTVSFRSATGGQKIGRTIASLADIDPQTKLEMEVAKLLAASGNADERDVMDAEAAELALESGGRKGLGLPDNATSVEAVEARQKQLQKMRHLMFYDEMKKKRTAKIKSKLYRKIRKRHNEAVEEKQRQRLRELDPELAKKLDEKDALERARLRVSLKHRTTSKWMKKNLKRNGGGTDQSKRAVQAELKEREKLHNKIMSRPQGNLDKHGGGDGDNSSDDEEGANDPAALRKQVVGLITEVEGDRNLGEGEGAKKKQDGIMGMKFMQRSLQKRREAALDDAKKLLRDIDGDGGDGETGTPTKQREGGEGGDDDGESSSSSSSTGARGRRKFGGGSSATTTEEDGGGGAKKRARNSSRSNKVDQSQAAQQLRKELRGSQQTASVEMGAGTSTSVSGAISGKVTPARSQSSDAVGLFDSSPAVAWDSAEREGGSGPQKANAPDGDDSHTGGQTPDEEVENPWMSGTHTRRKRSSRAAGSTATAAAAAAADGGGDDANKVAEVVSRLAEQQQAREEQERNGNPASKKKKKNKKNKNNNDKGNNNNNNNNSNGEAEAAGDASDQEDDSGGQAQIVARAFASAGGFKEAFEEEKRRETEEALPQEEKALVGWGSWAGIGAPAPSKRKVAAEAKKKAAFQQKKRKLAEVRKDAKLPAVVISEKRDKKASKYKVETVPYPFKTREQYERSLKRALGQEWNTLNTVKQSTKPEVLTRAGVAIAPLEKQRRRKQNKGRKSKL